MRSPMPALLPAAIAAAFACGAASAADWMQFGYDAAHTGVNPSETLISASNVASLVTKYSVNMAAYVDSAPVYLANVSTPGGTKNVLYALGNNGRERQ